MSNINFLKPDRTNLNTFLYLGSFLFFIAQQNRVKGIPNMKTNDR